MSDLTILVKFEAILNTHQKCRTVDAMMNNPSGCLDRHTRRRLRTRTDLLRAALRLFGERHPEDVAVQDITRVADVGNGSFYNHFDDKAAIYEAVIRELVEGWDAWLWQAVGNEADPALRLSHWIRGNLERGQRDPDYAAFISSNGLRLIETHGASGSLPREIDRGLGTGRFVVADPQMVKRAAAGVVLATQAALSGRRNEVMASSRAAWYVLTLLGIAREEADRLVSLPFPAGEPDDYGLVERHHLRHAV